MEGYGQLQPFYPNFGPKFYNLPLTMALIRTNWDSALKKIIKDEIGKGWNIEEQSNNVKLVVRSEHGKQAVTLPISC